MSHKIGTNPVWSTAGSARGGRADLLVTDLVHELEALQRLLDADANVLLRQGARPEAVVEVEQALVGLDSQERCHIFVVGQSG